MYVKGKETIATIKAKEDPIKVSIIASNPFPSINNLCPGRIERDIDGSGAPRKTEGIESRNVFVIDMDKISITRLVGEMWFSKIGEVDTIKIANKLVWMPGN